MLTFNVSFERRESREEGGVLSALKDNLSRGESLSDESRGEEKSEV